MSSNIVRSRDNNISTHPLCLVTIHNGAGQQGGSAAEHGGHGLLHPGPAAAGGGRVPRPAAAAPLPAPLHSRHHHPHLQEVGAGAGAGVQRMLVFGSFDIDVSQIRAHLV